MVNASGGALGVDAGHLHRCSPSTARPGAFGASGRALNVVYGVEESRGMVRRKLTDLATDARRHRALRRRAGRDLPRRPDRRRPLRQDRPRLDGRDDLVLRALAGGARRGHRRLRDRLRPARPTSSRARSAGSRRAPSVGVVLWIVALAGLLDLRRATSRATAPSTAPSRAAIVLLLWLYLSANAFLFGAELNAELERSAGAPARVAGPGSRRRASARSVSSGG